MNKEVKYLMQGFLLMLFLFGIVVFVDYVLSLPPRSTPATTATVQATTPAPAPVKTVANTKGKELFQMNCAACHHVHKELTGPALAGIEERVPDQKLLYDWIRDSQAVLKSGNEYFKNLTTRYNNMPMVAYAHLTDEEIAAILEYIKEASAASASASAPAPATAAIFTQLGN